MNYDEAIKSKPVVMVEFYATWCPHCRAMAPVVEQIKEMVAGQVDIYQLDVDKNSAADRAEQIESTPTFIIYKNGEEVWRESGEMNGQLLLDKILSFVGD